MKVDICKLDSTLVSGSSVSLSSEVFSCEIRNDILSQTVNWQLAKRRVSSNYVQQRSDVSGSTKKLFKQKGSGRARSGSMKAPHKRGGGKAFGPTNSNFSFKLNKKVRLLGLKSSLSLKYSNGDIKIVDLSHDFNKTKEMYNALIKFESKSLLIVANSDDYISLLPLVRNIPNVNILDNAGLNVYDILRHDKILISENILSSINERFGV
ncbi:MAG: 50S ribosomal protein L4 [Cyanobacteria bacterium P01_A01_bin.68]